MWSERVLWGGGGLLLGAALIALSLPVAASALIRLPSTATVEALHDGAPVAAADLERVLAAESAARSWRSDGDGYLRQGLVHLTLAEQRSGAAATDHLRAAEEALIRGLARTPASPHGWTRLAMARYLLERPDDETAAALAMAIRTGPAEAALTPARAELALRLWPAARKAVAVEALYTELRRAWDGDPELMTRSARAAGRVGALRHAISGGQRPAP